MFKKLNWTFVVLLLLVGCGKVKEKYEPFETLDGVGENAYKESTQTESLRSIEFLSNSIPGAIPVGKANAKFHLIKEKYKENRVAQISLQAKGVAGDQRARIVLNEMAGEKMAHFKYVSFHSLAPEIIPVPQSNNVYVHMYISLTCEENDPNEHLVVVDFMVSDDLGGLGRGPGPRGMMNRYQFNKVDPVYLTESEDENIGLNHISSGETTSMNRLIQLNPEACIGSKGIELVFGLKNEPMEGTIQVDDINVYFDGGAGNRMSYSIDFEEEEKMVNTLSAN